MAADHDDDKTRSHLVLKPGTRIGRFEILDRIGAGGMGEVYLALDTSLDRKVAMKFLPDTFVDHDEVRRRFVREAKAAASLNHPNIVTVHEVSEFDGRPYFVMEHVEGQTLQDVCREQRPALSRVLDLASQIGSALAHAHQKDIVHRDIKSANIVIDTSGRPRVIDFGLAAIADDQDLTRDGSTLGTMPYMSPEQARGEVVDARSDVFSFGVVLYEMLAGRSPFRRDTDVATMQAVINEPAEPVGRFAAQVPPEMERIIAKLLEKDPELRYQTAADAVADVNRLRLEISGRSTTAASVQRSVAAPANAGHRTWGVRIAGIVAVLIIVVLLVTRPWSLDGGSSGSTVTASEPRLAVMYFRNLVDPEDSDRLGEIAASLVITDLSESDYVQVVSSQRLYDILNKLGEGSARTVSRDVAGRVAQEADARWVLDGDILQVEPFLLITSQIVDVATGDITASQRIQGKQGESLFDVIDQLTIAVKSDLRLPAEAMTEEDPTLASQTTTSTEAYGLLVEAKEEILAFNRNRAVPLLKRAIEIDSAFAMAYVWLTIASDSDSLRSWAMSRAMRLGDRVSPLERSYIEILHRQLSGDIVGALDTLEAVLENHPDDKMTLLAMASVASNRFPQRAKWANHRILDVDPLYRLAYNSLAYIYAREHKDDSALWAINEYIRLGPDDANPYDTRGELLMISGRIPEAIESFKMALERDPTFRISQENLMYCYILDEQWGRADSLVRARIEQTPAKWVPYQEIALTYIPAYRGQYARTSSLLSAMLQVDSVQGVTDAALTTKLGTLALMHMAMDRPDSVLAVLNQQREVWLSATPSPTSLLGMIVHAHRELGQETEAREVLDVLREAAAFDPAAGSDPGNLVGLGIAYQSVGQLDSAIMVYEYMDSQHPSCVARLLLGVFHLQKGDVQAAVKHLQEAVRTKDKTRVQIAPIANNVYYWLGRAYERAGRQADAQHEYEAYLHHMRDGDSDVPQVIDARKRLKAM